MDIQYLLFLQEFRNRINDAWTPFMEWVSMFAVTYLILIPVFVYWCIDKMKGLYTLATYYVCIAVNAVVKLTACIYRPWIRDSRVLPAGDSIRTATGYSFPSGHTTTAAPLYGGLAVSAWEKKSLRGISVLCVLCALLTGFSRNYLGVHTPQDVFVGISEAIFWLIIMSKLFGYLEEHPEKEDWFLLIAFAACLIGLIYITFKGYPMDYNAEGKLIVDPQKMMNDGYGDIGKLMGFVIARFIEKRWVRFRSAGFTASGILLSAIGLVPAWVLIKYAKPAIQSLLGGHWGKLSYNIIFAIYLILVYPLVIRLVTGRKEESEVAGRA